MKVDRKWVERNLGYDPIAQPPPLTTFAFARAAKVETIEDFQREIIDFDSEAPAGLRSSPSGRLPGCRASQIFHGPGGSLPKPASGRPGKNGPLPRADVLLVTWTVDEGHALSRVLTPGKDSRNDYLAYTHNFAKIS